VPSSVRKYPGGGPPQGGTGAAPPAPAGHADGAPATPRLRLRPHHVLCATGFAGRGYSDAFTANMAAIVDARLRARGGDAVAIEITDSSDPICAPCPHRRGAGCTRQAKIDALDARHAAALGLAPGDVLTWGAAQERIAARVAPDDLDRLCAGCQWLPLGLCKAAVARLRAGPDEAGP